MLLTVTDGPLAGQILRSDTSGAFVLRPPSDEVFSISFELPGYENVTYRITDVRSGSDVDVEMRPAAGTVSFTASGSDGCSDLPKETLPCASGPNCWSGPVITSFPVYHSGELVVNDLLVPAWGSPSMDVIKRAPDGRAVSWRPYSSRVSIPLEAGYRYTLGFSGDVFMCSPFRVSLVRPR